MMVTSGNNHSGPSWSNLLNLMRASPPFSSFFALVEFLLLIIITDIVVQFVFCQSDFVCCRIGPSSSVQTSDSCFFSVPFDHGERRATRLQRGRRRILSYYHPHISSPGLFGSPNLAPPCRDRYLRSPILSSQPRRLLPVSVPSTLSRG